MNGWRDVGRGLLASRVGRGVASGQVRGNPKGIEACWAQAALPRSQHDLWASLGHGACSRTMGGRGQGKDKPRFHSLLACRAGARFPWAVS